MLQAMRSFGFVLCAALSVGAGCSSDDGADESEHIGHDDEGDDADDESALEDAPCTDAYPTYEPGALTAEAGDLTVRLVSANPAPPGQKRANDFTVEILNADGTPAERATIVNADSWMPAHNHGGRTEPDVEKLDAPGRFLLDDIDFRMLGPWQVRMDVRAEGETSVTKAILQLCVQ